MAFEEQQNIKYNHLVELNDSDYEIVDHEPNINGWEVKDGEGAIIGVVDDMLFDPEQRKVRYMIVELDEDYYTGNTVEVYENDVTMPADTKDDDYERRVLIPIGIAELNEDYQDVILSGVSELQIKALPTYDRNQLNPLTEASIRDIFAGNPDNSAMGDYDRESFYNHEHFNYDKFYSLRPKKDAQPKDKVLDIGKEPGEGNDSNPII